jgi:hypothetical protein
MRCRSSRAQPWLNLHIHPWSNRCTHLLKFDCSCTLHIELNGQRTAHITGDQHRVGGMMEKGSHLHYPPISDSMSSRTRHSNAQIILHVDHSVPRQTSRKRRRTEHSAMHQDGAAVPTLPIITHATCRQLYCHTYETRQYSAL